MNLSSTRPWMGERVYWSLADAFGKEPRLYQSLDSPFRSVAFLFGPDEIFDQDLLPNATKVAPVAAYPHGKDVLRATDNWPFLYLASNAIPKFSLVVFGIGMALSFLIVLGVEPALRIPNLHFFFLGAGFMLLETRSITQMALLFGSTWNVNAIVFVSILTAILITNQMVLKGWMPRPEISYAILFFVLALGYVFPFDR